MACTNYSIVSYLLGEDFKVVRELQKEISKVTGSQKCLIDWLPHITVGDGIIVENESLAEIEENSLYLLLSKRLLLRP